MKKYLYNGDQVMNFTLRSKDELKDFVLVPGEFCEVPADNEHIKTLIGKGFLTEVEEPKKDTKTDKNK